jgi:hypothetical protein
MWQKRALFAVASAFSCACLPNDTRKPPGSVLVTIASDGVAASGIPSSVTLDGWSISFERVLVALGDVSLDGDSCDVYSDSSYDRIFDMKTAGKQKVSIVYALGHCDFGFRVSSPNADTVVGQGATDADKTMMRTPASDAFTTDSGMSLYVRGHATRGDVTKTFEWPFRFRARYERCSTSPDLSMSNSTSDTGLDFRGNVAQSVFIEVRPGVLFANRLDTTLAQPRFQVFADADTVTGNDDGAVTLDELARVSLAQSGFVDLHGSADAGPFAGVDAGYVRSVHLAFDGGSGPSLEDYIYLVLFPAVVRYDGNGVCAVRLTNRGIGS